MENVKQRILKEVSKRRYECSEVKYNELVNENFNIDLDALLNRYDKLDKEKFSLIIDICKKANFSKENTIKCLCILSSQQKGSVFGKVLQNYVYDICVSIFSNVRQNVKCDGISQSVDIVIDDIKLGITVQRDMTGGGNQDTRQENYSTKLKVEDIELIHLYFDKAPTKKVNSTFVCIDKLEELLNEKKQLR